MSVITTKASNLASLVRGKTVMSGIQPSGVFHLGNLLGAVAAWRQIVDLRGPAEIVYMVADLHSLTVPRKPEVLLEQRFSALASLLACGINPEKCNVYFQSAVPAHARLHWVLSSVSSMGYLSRMTQWKSKAGLEGFTDKQFTNSEAQKTLKNVNLALFSYPVLMAADVLVNGADVVPVGEDQKQHMELTRQIASSFNFLYGTCFKAPQTVLTPYKRVLSLRDPLKKMSKSDPDQSSCIYITDDETTIANKIKRSVTDSLQGSITSYDPENRPAVSNLVLLASGLLEIEPQQFLDKYQPKNHMQLKQMVTEAVNAGIQPINREYHRIIRDRAYLQKIAESGAMRARERTDAVYEAAAKKVGL